MFLHVFLFLLGIEFLSNLSVSCLELLNDFLLCWYRTFAPVMGDDLIDGGSMDWIDLQHAVDQVHELGRESILVLVPLNHRFPKDV